LASRGLITIGTRGPEACTAFSAYGFPTGHRNGAPAEGEIARGVDDRPVLANRIRKSVGAENTFSADLFTFEEARDALLPIIDKVWRYYESAGTRGRTVTLKIKYADFQQITRSQSLRGMVEERMELEKISLDLLRAQFPMTKGIRLLGISLSALSSSGTVDAEQLPLGI
jgi:DNA polymerase-4